MTEQRAYFLPKFLNDDLFFTTVAIHEPDTEFGFETPESAKGENEEMNKVRISIS